MNAIRSVDCIACGKKQLLNNEISLNKKILGRGINQFYCLNCLAEYLEITPEELLHRIEYFKSQGCTLFD